MAVLVAAALLVGGCGSDDGPRSAGGAASTNEADEAGETGEAAETAEAGEAADSTTSTVPEPVEGLLATLAPNRLYVTQHALGLGILNVGEAPVDVATVALESGLFEPADGGQQGVLLQPDGGRFVLPVPYGDPVCDGAVDEHVAVVTLSDGRDLRVPAVEEFSGAVARLHERECLAVAVLERADVRFGDEWSRDGLAVNGTVELEERTPGDAVALDGLRGNVIFTLTAGDGDTEDGDDDGDGGGEPLLSLHDERTAASLPVTISADRCDPHAVAEFKRPYVMLAWVSLGDEAAAIEIEATGAARAALDELIAACSTG